MYNLIRSFLVLTLLFVTFTAAAQPDPEDRKLTIRGQVRDAELKEPMVQATIQLFAASDSTLVTSEVIFILPPHPVAPIALKSRR